MKTTTTQPMTYTKLRNKHQEELNKFKGLFFAFNNEQFKNGMKKVGLTIKDTNKVCSIGSGGYLLKSKKEAFIEMFTRHDEENKEFRKDQKNLFNALVYELANHEYNITGDPRDALESLGLTHNDVDPKLLRKACKKVC